MSFDTSSFPDRHAAGIEGDAQAASPCCKAISAALRPVMSRATTRIRTGWPFPSRTTGRRSAPMRTVPSGRR